MIAVRLQGARAGECEGRDARSSVYASGCRCNTAPDDIPRTAPCRRTTAGHASPPHPPVATSDGAAAGGTWRPVCSGPGALARLEIDAQGRVANYFAGAQVLFNGVAAPLLAASNAQVNAVVPQSVFQGG